MKLGHLIYFALALLGLALAVIPFFLMRKTKRGRGYHPKGFMLLGPLHFVLAKREYTLTPREIVLVVLVVLLVLVVPLITYFLEGR
jgi:uncharacterized membrane protein